MPNVNRESLLRVLQDLEPGLSMKDSIEQSKCFVFTKGYIVTFNDQIACRKKITKDIDIGVEGAVPARRFMQVLEQMPDETLDVSVDGGKIQFKGKGRKLTLVMEAEVLMDTTVVEKPGKWNKLPEEFETACSIVCNCASNDESMFANTCVHMTPSYVEASDRFQIARHKLKMNMDGNILVSAGQLKAVIQRAPEHYAVTTNWVHFKTPTGLILSCRLHVDDFPEIGQYLKVKGKKLILPKGLTKPVDTANIFSSENDEDNFVRVDLRPGKVRVTGTGASGSYEETKNVKYQGPQLRFYIGPGLLNKLVTDHSECEVSETAMRVNGGSFVYVTALEPVE